MAEPGFEVGAAWERSTPNLANILNPILCYSSTTSSWKTWWTGSSPSGTRTATNGSTSKSSSKCLRTRSSSTSPPTTSRNCSNTDRWKEIRRRCSVPCLTQGLQSKIKPTTPLSLFLLQVTRVRFFNQIPLGGGTSDVIYFKNTSVLHFPAKNSNFRKKNSTLASRRILRKNFCRCRVCQFLY